MTCKKQRVVCVITLDDGSFVVGENECEEPQEVCPRAEMATGEGYHLCVEVCKQKGHAEAVAASLVPSDKNGVAAYLFGHTYACDDCKSKLRQVGVQEVVIVK